MVLGAAIGGAVASVPSWTEAFSRHSTGGVLTQMLSPAKGFGKFVAVVLAFSVLANMAGSMYSITVQFQILLPILAKIPRFIFAIVISGVIIAVSIPIAHTFEESLENFLGVISYWVAVFVGIVSTEHLYFKRGKAANYDHAIWNVASKLPLGFAAMAAGALPFALIIPCMSETWYTGPVAKKTGDIGFEVGFALSVLLYIPFRTIELKFTGR